MGNLVMINSLMQTNMPESTIYVICMVDRKIGHNFCMEWNFTSYLKVMFVLPAKYGRCFGSTVSSIKIIVFIVL